MHFPINPSNVIVSDAEIKHKRRLLLRDRLNMNHITVQRRGKDPQPQRCHEDANLFTCPFCSSDTYKPCQYHQIMTHIAGHKLRSVEHGVSDISEPHETYNGEVNSEDFWETLSMERIAAGLLKTGDRNPYNIKPNFEYWAPWIGRYTRKAPIVLNTEWQKVQSTSAQDLITEMDITEERLSDELMKLKVAQALSVSKDDEVAYVGSTVIKQKDFTTLTELSEVEGSNVDIYPVNSHVIVTWLPPICAHPLDSLPPEISSKDAVVFPSYVPGHWMLCIMKPKLSELYFLNSLRSPGFGDGTYIAIYREIALSLCPGPWTEFFSEDLEDVPRQELSCSCGVFTLMYALYITLGGTFDFSELPLVVLRAILLEVVVHDGDVAIRTLALTCSCFNNIVCMESFRREAHFRWLDSVVNWKAFSENFRSLYRIPYSISRCLQCDSLYKHYGAGYRGRGQRGVLQGFYSSDDFEGYCGSDCFYEAGA
ncbi:hypothetical protein cypCar_00027344 [Cyprinus carpio]|nr:hypothetical protein cypCar_00027344 [Cyprinus carpio]